METTDKHQTTEADIVVRVKVDGNVDINRITRVVAELLGEGASAAELYFDDPEIGKHAQWAASVKTDVVDVLRSRVCGPDVDVYVNVDEATYLGDEEDGVYFQVFECSGGKFWYSTLVDCNSGGFVQGMSTGAGPYDSYDAAEEAGRNEAFEWCAWNDVDLLDSI